MYYSKPSWIGAAAVCLLLGSTGAWGQQECAEEVQKLLPSDGAAGDNVAGVALRGDVAVMGAWKHDDNGADSGAAWVFRFDGAQWIEEQELLASDGAPGDWFGPVATDGQIVVIGAIFDNDNGVDSGSVYVFRYNGAEWIEEQKLLASDGAAGDHFGVYALFEGDVMVIAADGDDDNGSDSGSVYVFRYNGAEWIEEQKLLASDGAAGDLFREIAISGDVVVIGARLDDGATGSAYVFRYNGAEWIEEQKILASDGASGDYFGWSVGLAGDVAVIGAPLEDNEHGSRAGSAYVFRYNGAEWIEEQKLVASDGVGNEDFGRTVAIDGDVMLIGSVFDDDNGFDSGSAFIFLYDGSQWIEKEKLIASDGEPSEWFGGPLALNGNIALIAAYHDDDNGVDSGSVYVFDISDCLGPGDCVEPPPDLVGWWPGDGNATDIAGGNSGTILGGMGFDEGMVDQAFRLDNVNDGVGIPNIDGVYDLVEEWTLDAWVFPFAPGFDPRNDPIVWKTDSGNKDTFYIAWGCSACPVTSRFQTGLERASDDDDFRTASKVHPPGAWYHVAGVYDGTDLIIYVNGVEEGRETIGSVVAYTTPDPLTIGNILHSNHGNAGVFDGSIDEVDVFDRALSAEEIAAIYLAGSAGKCKPEITTATLLSFNVAGGNLVGGDLQSLEESDDDYVQIDAQLSNLGTAYISRTLVRAKSPATTVSRLDLTLETGVDAELVTTRVFLLNFDTGDWDLLDGFTQSEADSEAMILDVPNPNAYVRDDHGQIAVQIETRANAAQVPDGYIFRIDHVELAVTTGEGGGIAGGDDDAFACDLDGDGIVGASDLVMLLGAWGKNPGHPADFNGDGMVNAADLIELLGNWGPCPK